MIGCGAIGAEKHHRKVTSRRLKSRRALMQARDAAINREQHRRRGRNSIQRCDVHSGDDRDGQEEC